jgi:hypothetical protein
VRFFWLVFVALVWAMPGQAHTLGVDKGDLVEMADGSYHLVSRVPKQLQHMIRAPQ